MNKIDNGTIARLVVLTIVLINTILEVKGMSLIPFDEAYISEFVSIIALIVTSIWTTWKNNNFTKNAIQAQKFKNKLDKGEVEVEFEEVVKDESEVAVDNEATESDDEIMPTGTKMN
ncbi:phage holin [Macrococcus armenti]|uniref:phage holin n=1 Tax=Macrococcus armenti TaxID=2875764 RepID=UPI001CCF13C1|nr:phage holin [Macrococcus armenti]UBH16414.1 phage holin [Macrococcus armenti]UBH18770.1 phage holin [Macrococcus armenti]UBH21042.1 phage holin [Macrococcus armenti]